ncbi:MAG: glycosyltransferase family 39 protein [Anaerolineae bacterium]
MGLLLVAFGLQASGLVSQGLWRDEVDAIRFARRPLAALLETFRTPGQNGPLYYLLLRPWLELAGQGEFALRFFSTLFGVLAVALTARLGRRLFPARPAVGLLAALLAATAPYLVWYGQEGKMYTLVVALVLLSTERYTAALLRGGWQRWLAYVVFTSLLFYVHLTAVLIVPAQALAFFLVGREVRRARWKGWLASLAALTVPYLPLLAWQWPLLRAGGQTGYAFVPLPQMVLSLLTSYSLGVVGHGAPWALVPFVALLLAVGLGRAWPGRALRAPRGILLCWLVVPVVGFFLVTLLRPIYTARYLIFVLPAYLLLLAVGLEAVARHSRLLAAALLLGLLALNGWGLWLQARTPLKADFRAATAYVVEHRAADDLLLFQIPYGRHSFDYYRSQQAAAESAPVPGQGDFRLMLPLVIGGGPPAYSWAEGLYTNAGMAPEEAARQMAALTAGYRGVWLVATEVPLWDERGLVQAWLEEHAVREEEAHFVRVDVYYYRLEGD